MNTIRTHYTKNHFAMVAGGAHSAAFKNIELIDHAGENQSKEFYTMIEAELDSRTEILNQTSMVTITDQYGTIIYANDLFCSISGFGRHEVIGNTHNIIRHPELSESTVVSIWKMLRNGNTWQGELKSRRKNGQDFWTNMTIAPIKDHSGSASRFVWVRNDITRLKKTEIELFTAKQRADQQLLDNVKNALRIQQALLPAEQELRKIFPSSFLFFNPQQNVSGDFYWFERNGDESIILLGDGTGHGVSASFVSLMALTGLRYILENNEECDPGKMLTELNNFMFRAMNKHNNSGLSESVDMSFCRYNHTTRRLTYASGKSRMYICRNGVVESLSTSETSIGSVNGEECTIISRHIDLLPGDRIFLMSDGFADQFGGERNKRLGSRHVKQLLECTSRMPIHEQKAIVRKNFLLWKGENEQTDDLSLIAFEIN